MRPSEDVAVNGQRSLARRLLFPILVLLLGLLLVAQLTGGTPREEIRYSRFLDLVEDGKVIEVEIGEETVTGTYGDGELVDFTTVRPAGVEEAELISVLREHDVEFTGSRASGLRTFLRTMLVWIVPFVLIVAFWLFIMRRTFSGGAGAMSLGRSQHKVYDRQDLRTSFSDVAGLDEAGEEVREVVDFLKEPERYRALGARIPKGVLLVGPPGTGKTLLARAIAGEADVPFFYLSGSNFVQMFVGLGAARVRDLFEHAKARAPCIVFIDELDTIGRSRVGGVPGTGGFEEREQTLNQLLSEMDGFDPSAGVILMAATNRPDVLDPALLRPGRFDRQIVVDLPDRRGRAAILRVHARSVALADDADLDVLAARTPGLAGAELANVVNEAALLAARRRKQLVGMKELEEGVDRVSIGLERRSRVLSEPERERVAYHELGHALTALSCPHADPVHRVSIVPRGAAAIGVTQQLPAEDRYLITGPELEDRLAVMMGGRSAERLVYGDFSTGAQNDLQQATALARRMVEEFGMSEKVGPVALTLPPPFLRPDREGRMPPEVRSEIRRLLEEAEDRATTILEAQRAELDDLATLLVERETLERADLDEALAESRSAHIAGVAAKAEVRPPG